jgi:hypothetical protein
MIVLPILEQHRPNHKSPTLATNFRLDVNDIFGFPSLKDSMIPEAQEPDPTIYHVGRGRAGTP